MDEEVKDQEQKISRQETEKDSSKVKNMVSTKQIFTSLNEGGLKEITSMEKIERDLWNQMLEMDNSSVEISDLTPIKNPSPVNRCQRDKFIFMEKKFDEQFPRVSNLLKHYLRQFIEHVSDFQGQFTATEKSKNKKILNTLKKKLKEKEQAITQKDISRILNTRNKELSKKNRKIMRRILMADICFKSGEKNRIYHLHTARVFALRCLNHNLVERNVSH